MDIVSRVTVRHLKENKKRTIVTILGIMLSVALIMAISAFAESFLDMMRQSSIACDGEWHVRFEDVPAEKLPEISGDEAVKKTLVSRSIGNSRLENCANEAKPYLYIKAYNKEAMEEYPTTLLEGRYPQAEDEILLPEHLETNGGIHWTVGDVITVNPGKRMIQDDNGEPMEAPYYYPYFEGEETLEENEEKTYTVVGIMERPVFESYNQGSYTAITWLDEAALLPEEQVTAAVQMEKLSNELYAWGDQKAQELEVSHTFNTELLSYYLLSGKRMVVSMLNTVKWVMMLIVAGGSAAVIYSSFSISVSERIRYLGMLASVGATRKQKRRSVFTEAALLGSIGIPLGLLLGYTGVWVTTLCIRGLVTKVLKMEGVTMRVILSWPGILGAVLLAAVTIFISAWIPARRASRITPVEAIRQNRDIKLTSRQVKTSRLTRAVFGFEGELALKNLKRNKKRYRATVISLVFCLVLYLSVASFTAYLRGAYRMEIGLDSVNEPDISVYLYASSDEELKERTEEILELDHITGTSVQRQTGIYSYLKDGSCLSDSTRELLERYGNEEQEEAGQVVGPYGMNIVIIGMDDESLREYASRTGADEELLFDQEKTGVIIVNRRQDHERGKTSWQEIFQVGKGDVIETRYPVWELPEDGSEDGEAEGTEVLLPLDLTVAAVTEELPLGGGYYDNIYSVSMYTTMENCIRLEKSAYENSPLDVQIKLNTDSHDELKNQLDDISEKKENMYVYSRKEEMDEVNDLLILINVFVYGFIILTALICVTSIFNTISTSVALRRREYAMLKSVGMSPGRLNRMIAYESMFYGIKALLYGLPLGILFMYIIYRSIARAFDIGFYILWNQVAAAVISVFLVVSLTMWYSSRKIKKANVVDVLKDENI